MRVELIGHFKTCMTEIYLHIDARVADYMRTHPYLDHGSAGRMNYNVNYSSILMSGAEQMFLSGTDRAVSNN